MNYIFIQFCWHGNDYETICSTTRHNDGIEKNFLVVMGSLVPDMRKIAAVMQFSESFFN
jgi:hypothetical protein